MSQQLQLIFNRTIATKQEIRELKAMIKDALENSNAYQSVKDEISRLKEREKQIKENIMDEFVSEKEKIEDLNSDEKNDKILMADKALADLVAGKTVEVKDKNGNRYEPIFSVKFIKA